MIGFQVAAAHVEGAEDNAEGISGDAESSEDATDAEDTIDAGGAEGGKSGAVASRVSIIHPPLPSSPPPAYILHPSSTHQLPPHPLVM